MTRVRAASDSGRAFRRRAMGVLAWPVRAVRHVWRNRRYLTAYKLLNMACLRLEARLRRPRPWGLPYVFKVEPTNICNGTCRLCPTGAGRPGRARGKMDYTAFCRIIDSIHRFAYVVDLSNWGDPLVHPDIYRMIRYAHDAGIWTYLSSNLHAFRPAAGDAENLVRSGLDMLNCSLHAVTQEVYERYQPGRKLGPVLEGIRALLEARRRLGTRTPAVRLFFVVTRYNEHEIDAFQELADSLGCEAVFIPASLNLRFLDRDAHAQVKEGWLPGDERWIAPWYRPAATDEARSRQTGKIYPCDWPWRAVVINWDGSVSVCCGDYDPACDLGNVLETPLRTIWTGEAYRAVRRSFLAPGDATTREPCRSCCGVLI